MDMDQAPPLNLLPGWPSGYLIADNAHWSSNAVYCASLEVTSALPKGIDHVYVGQAYDPDGMQTVLNSSTTVTIGYAGNVSDTTAPLRPAITADGDGSLTTISSLVEQQRSGVLYHGLPLWNWDIGWR